MKLIRRSLDHVVGMHHPLGRLNSSGVEIVHTQLSLFTALKPYALK